MAAPQAGKVGITYERARYSFRVEDCTTDNFRQFFDVGEKESIILKTLSKTVVEANLDDGKFPVYEKAEYTLHVTVFEQKKRKELAATRKKRDVTIKLVKREEWPDEIANGDAGIPDSVPDLFVFTTPTKSDTNAESSPRTSPWTFPINAGLFDVVDDFPTRPYPTIEMDVDQPKVAPNPVESLYQAIIRGGGKKMMEPEDVATFYDLINPSSTTPEAPQPEDMRSDLYPYQLRAVHWMVDREINTPLDGIKGGVLADEVGLGKTLEILGLVSSNKRYSERNMMLPSPDPAEASFDSKATLIISPKYMVAQWQSEVAKHCNESVKVVVYEGMKAMQKLLGIRSSEEAGYYFRTNNVFATYDVVLTSYEVLRQEVYFTDEFAARVTRADAVMPKEKIRTPLVLCRWWRVCMDEAQELKLSTTQTARMALRVPAYYRWGVSGTPIKRIFADIKGLLEFLRAPEVWRLPVNEMMEVLKKIMWRRSNAHVKHEIEIPPVVRHSITPKLTNFERYCYYRLKQKLGDDEINWDKFTSSPFNEVVVNLFDIVAKNADKNTVQTAATLFINEAKSSLQALHVELCDAMNALGVRFEACGEYEKAVGYFTNALDLGQYNFDRSVLAKKCAKLLIPGYHLDLLASVGSSTAIYRALNHLWEICVLQKNADMEVQYRKQLDEIKKTVLAQPLQVFQRTSEKYIKVRQEASSLKRNRLRTPRKPWYIRALALFANNAYRGTKLLQELRTGHKFQSDTKLFGRTEDILQLENADFDTIEDKIEEFLSDLATSRKQLSMLLRREIPSQRSEIDEYQSHLEETEAALVHFEQLQVEAIANTDLHAGGSMTRKLSLGERVLLFLERNVILWYNDELHIYETETKKPDPDPEVLKRQLKIIDTLSLLYSEAQAHFREFELNKVEVVEGGHLYVAQSKYLEALRALELRAVDESAKDSSLDELAGAFEDKMTECLKKKRELESLIEFGTQDYAPEAIFGSKLESAAQALLAQLKEDERVKALVFSISGEPLVQFAKILVNAGVSFSSGANIPGLDMRGNLTDRIAAFKQSAHIRVLFLNSLKQSTGLTLTQANNIFLLENIDPANEKQAIGRCFRIGQRRNTNVFTFNVNMANQEVPEEPPATVAN